MSNHYYNQGPPSASPFYASHHGGPPPSQQQQQQSSYGQGAATSPVSSYSNSPPQQQPPPLRPHTAAPYASQGYAPPSNGPPSGYYQQQPQGQSQQAPAPAPGGGGGGGGGGYRTGRPDFSPPQPQPPQPLQTRQEYGQPPPSAGFSPDLPRIIANTHGLPPDVVQRLAEDLMRSIQFSNLGGGQPVAAPPQGAAPLLSHPVPPQQQGGSPVAATVPAPPQPQHQLHGSYRPQPVPQIPGAFPTYAGPGPEPAPGPPPPNHSHHQQRPGQSQHYGPPPSQQSYFPPQPSAPTPAPASAPAPPHSKIPIPAQVHEDGLGRKGSHRHSKSSAASGFSYNSTPGTSTASATAGKPKMTMDEGSIHFEIWGELVDKEPGREPRPREKLIGLLRDIGNYMIKERPVKDSIVITPDKMVDFYASNAVEGKDGEPLDWKVFFTGRSYSSLSSIYRALNCEHFYMPPASDQKPCIPALTPRGFETWMFTQLMSNPNREAARLQKIVSTWVIQDTKENRRYPKLIPRRCFPEKEDQIIRDGWWRVWEEFPPDYDEESEEETLALPAPGSHPYGPPQNQMTPPEGAEGPFDPPAYGRKKPPMAAPYPDDEEEDERLHRKGSKAKSPIDRPPKSYASESGGNRGWREDLGSRPTLGDDMKPPTRGQAPPPRPHTSHGHHPSTDDDKPRNSRQRDRSEYRSRRHQSRHQSRHRHASPSPDRDGDWSASSGISARTPGSADNIGPPLDAPAPAPGPPGGPPPVPLPAGGREKRHEERARVEREQRELFRKLGNDRHGGPDGADPYEFEEYRHPRDRERDDRRVAEYAYQDEYERDLRRQSASGAVGGPPGETSGRRSQYGGGYRRS